MDEKVTYVKFRYTFEKGPEQKYDGFEEMARDMVRRCKNIFRPNTVFTAGYEEKNRLGLPTHPHIHIHFDTKEKIQNVRARFLNAYKDELKNRKTGDKGSENKIYAMGVPKEEEGLTSLMRFVRYPWKQGCRISDGEMLPDDDMDYDAEKMRAESEYNTNKDWHEKAKAKAENKAKNSTYAKLKQAAEADRPKSFQQLCELALNVAVENEIAVNFQTLTGYCITYALDKKLIDRSMCVRRMTEIAGYVGNAYVPESSEEDEY